MGELLIIRRNEPILGIAIASYTGDFERDPSTGHIRFLTNGTLVLKQDAVIDAFLVGGGGAGKYGGGGGGYTNTFRQIPLWAGAEYDIVIGEGGVAATASNKYGSAGGQTSAFGYSAAGAGIAGQTTSTSSTTRLKGGDGGSGGGGGGSADGGDGGSNGANGESVESYGAQGAGQGYTTRAFGEEDGAVYAAGGGGCGGEDKTQGVGGEPGAGDGSYLAEGVDASGAPNTGSGGGGTWKSEKRVSNGGSGIAIIRKHKPIESNLYLYSPGDQHTGITGNWVGIKRDPTGNYTTTDRAPTILPNDNYLSADNVGSYSGTVYTALKIDMTPYKTLVFEGEFKRTGNYGTGFMPGVWSEMTGNANSTTRLAYVQQSDDDKDVIFNRYEIDVESVNEYGYVGISLANAYANITHCYLIPKEKVQEEYTFLYKVGNEYESFTGGWVGEPKLAASTSGVTKSANIVRENNAIILDNLDSKGGVIRPTLGVDLTPYKTLVFEGVFQRDGTQPRNITAAVWSKIGTYYATSSEMLVYYQMQNVETINRIELDVSNINQLGYPGIGVADSLVKITACYLKPKEMV